MTAVTATTPERVIFAQWPEALFLKAFADKVTPEVKARLRETGLDLDKALAPAYPFEAQAVWLTIAAEEFYPDLPRDEALHAIGLNFFSGWQETLLGRAAAAMFRVIGPRRSLLRVERAFRTSNNFTEVKAEELGPTCIRLYINEVHGAANYFAGLMVAGGHLTGAANPRATVERLEGPGAFIRVEWDGPAK